jgi:hypothetical protein
MVIPPALWKKFSILYGPRRPVCHLCRQEVEGFRESMDLPRIGSQAMKREADTRCTEVRKMHYATA